MIERVWKFMRRKLFNNKYYASFEVFKMQVAAFFAHLDQYRGELETLLTEEFESVPQAWQWPMAA